MLAKLDIFKENTENLCLPPLLHIDVILDHYTDTESQLV